MTLSGINMKISKIPKKKMTLLTKKSATTWTNSQQNKLNGEVEQKAPKSRSLTNKNKATHQIHTRVEPNTDTCRKEQMRPESNPVPGSRFVQASQSISSKWEEVQLSFGMTSESTLMC